MHIQLPGTTHFHIDFNLNHGLTDSHLNFLKDNVRNRPDLRVLTFQAATDCATFTIKNNLCYPASPSLSFTDQLANASESIRKIRDICGTHISIGIENNNYFPTGAFDICTSPRFLLEVIEKNDLHLLYDIAHANVTCHNKGLDLSCYESDLMNAPCFQLHLCQHTIPGHHQGYAYDSHELPSSESIESALALAKQYSIPFLTIEYYKNASSLINILSSLKARFQEG